jgi:hypothetical protein
MSHSSICLFQYFCLLMLHYGLDDIAVVSRKTVVIMKS